MSSSSSLSSVVCHHFSLDQIKVATNNFDVSNILGDGGEGTVYLGHIAIGWDDQKLSVAVKLLNPNSIEFEKEIKIVSKIQHPNLVSLLGYCNDLDQKILVYEYMQKGSLSDYVKKKNSICLSWKQRLNICLGAARGLQYLHTSTVESPKGIIHRDMKPANILLDKNWVAKVSDFGMFKVSHADQTNSTMITDLKGTCGYYAPEYFRTFQITRKIDVYAFGVVMFEMLCRKKPWDRGDDHSYYVRDDEDLGLWGIENADTEINGEISDDSLEIFADIVGRSLRPNPDMRPTMDEVVLDLERALKCQEREDHEGICPKALSVKKLIQNIKEITGNTEDDEIYAMVKECSMDSIQTIQKLLFPVMAGDLIGGAVIGAVFSELQTVVFDVIIKTIIFKSNLKCLQTTILSIKPMFDGIEKLGAVLNLPERETAMFVGKMKEGIEVILKSSKVKAWNFYEKYVYSKKLTEFDESLMRFFHIVQAAQSMYIRHIMLSVNTVAGAAD